MEANITVSDLFAQYSTEGRLQGKQAFELLSQSALPRDQLRHIWSLCDDRSRHFLDQEGFKLALKLVALVQQYNFPILSLTSKAQALEILSSHNKLQHHLPSPWFSQLQPSQQLPQQ